MKTSSFKQAWINVFLKPMIVIALFLASCFMLNFLLVPPAQASIIETILADANKCEENVDMIFLGSSRTYRGIDTPNISKNINKNVFNIAYENANYLTSYHLLKEICKENSLETLLLEVSMTNFTREDSTEDIYIYKMLTEENQKQFAKAINLEYNNSILLEFTNHLNNFSNGRFANNVKLKFSKFEKIGDTINNQNSKYMGNGFLYSNASAKGELSLPSSYLNGKALWQDNFAKEKQIEYFYNILEFCKEENIEVVLYSPPYPYDVSSDFVEDFNNFDNFVNETIKDYDLKYLDFSKVKKDVLELKNNYFYNANHCNGTGALALQPIISEILQEIQNNDFAQEKWFYQDYTQMKSDYNA